MILLKVEYLRLAVEPDSDNVRPSSPFTARRDRRISSGSRRTQDERRRSLRRQAAIDGDASPASTQPQLVVIYICIIDRLLMSFSSSILYECRESSKVSEP